MAKKKCAVKLSQIQRFSTDEAEEKFEMVKKKALYLEKGFLVKDSPSMGLPQFVAEVINQRGWRLFCTHPKDPCVPIVREFYSNLSSPNQTSVTVRGEDISF